MCDAILRNHINELQQTKPPANTPHANIPRIDRYCQSLFDFFLLFLTGNARLHSQSEVLHPPPQPGILKLTTPTIYANIICSFEMVERQS